MAFASYVGYLGFGDCFPPREHCVVRAACCEDKYCDGRKAVLGRTLSRTSARGVASFVVFGPVFLFANSWRTALAPSLVRPSVAWPTLSFLGQSVARSKTVARGVA